MYYVNICVKPLYCILNYRLMSQKVFFREDVYIFLGGETIFTYFDGSVYKLNQFVGFSLNFTWIWGLLF